MLRNGARPSGAMIVKHGENSTGTLSEVQFERIKQQIDELHTGTKNSGKPLLLEGGLEWNEMSIRPKDMDP